MSDSTAVNAAYHSTVMNRFGDEVDRIVSNGRRDESKLNGKVFYEDEEGKTLAIVMPLVDLDPTRTVAYAEHAERERRRKERESRQKARRARFEAKAGKSEKAKQAAGEQLSLSL